MRVLPARAHASALQLLKDNSNPNQKQIRKAIAEIPADAPAIRIFSKQMNTAAAAERSSGRGD